MNTDELTARVIELETRLAFQEDTLAQLDRLVAEQNRELLLLGQRLGRAHEKMEALEYQLEQSSAVAGNEKPPHY